MVYHGGKRREREAAARTTQKPVDEDTAGRQATRDLLSTADAVATEQVTSTRLDPDSQQALSRRWHVACSDQYALSNRRRRKKRRKKNQGGSEPRCTPLKGGVCDRMVRDEFLSAREVDQLIRIADRGMKESGQPTSGPTIMDVNSGWVLASGQHQPRSIYSNGQIFSEDDYALYKEITERLKRVVEETFDLSASALHFTAPTFITREVGDENWHPETMHDEYWHPHVDKNNTGHYDYSGLVYLSTQGEDFGPGGELHFYPDSSLDCTRFVDPVDPGPCEVVGPPELVVEPRRGRLIVFGSGRENPHRVTKVERGKRYVLSFWFTCDKRMRFKTFLDGKVHKEYAKGDKGGGAHKNGNEL